MNYEYIRNSLTTEASNTYLNFMIVPHLLYCMSRWSQACRTSLKPLESLNKRALKIHDKNLACIIIVIYLPNKKSGIFENLIKFSQISALCKIIHNTATPSLWKFIRLRSEKTIDPHGQLPEESAVFQDASFWSTIIFLLSLPNEIISCSNYSMFTRLTKQWLLSQLTCTHWVSMDGEDVSECLLFLKNVLKFLNVPVLRPQNLICK